MGDIVVNSLVDEDGHVAAFEELIGCHGGAGGLQTQPLLMYPAAWADQNPEIIGSEGVHAFISEHLGAPAASEDRTEHAESPAAERQVDVEVGLDLDEFFDVELPVVAQPRDSVQVDVAGLEIGRAVGQPRRAVDADWAHPVVPERGGRGGLGHDARRRGGQVDRDPAIVGEGPATLRRPLGSAPPSAGILYR